MSVVPNKSTPYSKLLPWVIVTSAILNILFIGYLVVQSSSISRLEKIVIDEASVSFDMAQKLADIERTIGYVGFIHHFKNYIIRGDEKYFIATSNSYSEAIKKIEQFEQMADSNELVDELEHVKQTLNEYHANLLYANSLSDKLDIDALDKRVAVNDAGADIALRTLQGHLLPQMDNVYLSATEELTSLSHLTLLFNLVIAPIIIAVSYFILRISQRVNNLSNELESILDLSPDGILYIDDHSHIIMANPKACAVLEYSYQELTSLTVESLLSPRYRKSYSQYQHTLTTNLDKFSDESTPRRVSAITKSGTTLDLEISLASGRIQKQNRIVCIFRDMGKHNALKQKAETDHLTNLLNRRMVDELLNKEIDRCHRAQQPLSLLLVDIDNFKSINDNLGHDIGDIAIQTTAHFLTEHTRSYDHVGRWGGDEFVLVCPNLNASDAQGYAQRLLTNYNELTLAQQQSISLSIGIATTSVDEKCVKHKLFKDADVALYNSKHCGKNCFTHVDHQALRCKSADEECA